MIMLDQKIAHDIIHEAVSLGADFCDIFIEKCEVESLSFNTSKIKDIRTGTDFGIGIRLIYGTKALYGYTNSMDKAELIKLTRVLAQQYKKQVTQISPLSFKTKEIKIIPAISDMDVSLKHKIAALKSLDSKVRVKSELIEQVRLSFLQKRQNIEIYNSEGLHATDFRPYCRLSSVVMAKEGSEQATGMWNPGARGGYEFMEKMDLDFVADYTVAQALTSLRAKPCPAGKMPVVIDNGFGGVIFHEACGHPLETTSVEKKASVFWDKKDEMIAHEALSAVDDGTIDFGWGSLSIDDEGMETQRTQLIKNGKLVNFMCDKLGEIKTGHPRTGSGRRESYKYAPASRMRNTYIEAGPHKVEALISSMEDGLYAKSMGGGSVNPGTGEFNFSVQEGYIVKNGKITDAVKGATLIGRGEEIMKNISMVADNFKDSAGMCGSVSGSIPAAVGQPAVKVDQILVGGRA